MLSAIMKVSAELEGGLIVVIGAGSGKILPFLSAHPPTRILLAEANGDCAELIRRGAGDVASSIEVHAVAVTPKPEASATLNVLSQASLSSLLPPGRMKEMLPNVSIAEQREVPAVEINAFLEEARPGTGTKALLVLDASGLSVALLEAVSPANLTAFSDVIVCGHEVSLYEGERSLEDALHVMAEAGFDLVEEAQDILYPERVLRFAANRERIERKALEVELAVERSRSARLEDELAERSGKFELAREEHDALLQSVEEWQSKHEVRDAELKAAVASLEVATAEASVLRAGMAELEKNNRSLKERQGMLEKQVRAALIEQEVARKEADRLREDLPSVAKKLLRAEVQVEFIRDVLLRNGDRP